jgi:predicted amidohydrolase
MLPRLAMLEPSPPAPPAPDPRLPVEVLFTSPALTEAALRRAIKVAESLQSRVVLTLPEVVPYPFPLKSRSPRHEALLALCEDLVRRAQPSAATPVTIHLCVCRDRNAAVAAALRSGSLVIIGCRRASWWPGEGRLVRQLRRLGHPVEVVNGRRGNS